MLNVIRIWSRTRLCIRFNLVIACVLLPLIGNAQTNQVQPYKRAPLDKVAVAKLISELKEGEPSTYALELLSQAGATDAIPLLEQQFAHNKEEFLKAKIAQVLVHLGSKNDTYWAYLVDLVTPFLNSGEPNPIAYDVQGKQLPGVAPEFEGWVIANKKVLDDAIGDADFLHPFEVRMLGLTEDSRAIPLLRKALTSPNYLIVATAALGLALLKDKESIPSIIQRVDRAPAAVAPSIVESLGYFDDPRAQNAFDRRVSKEYAQLFREARSKGKTPAN